MSSKTQSTLYCKMQNRLGALDRVLAAFTHRGIIPGRFASSHDEKNRAVDLVVTFDCSDTIILQKLVKFLQKQVYVLETKLFSHSASEAVPALESLKDPVAPPANTAASAPISNNVKSLFTTDISPERKISHANHA